MSDIFISYAREDRQKAELLARALERQSLSVWWDRTIPPGKTFDDVIEEAIDAARCIVVLWSKTAVASRWVRTEAQEGLDRGVLVPVLIEAETRPPLAFRRVQAADLIDWDGSHAGEPIQRLLEAINLMLEPSQAQEEERRQAEAETKRKAEEEERRQADERPDAAPRASIDQLTARQHVTPILGLTFVAWTMLHALSLTRAFMGAESFDALAHYLRQLGAPVLGTSVALWLVRLAVAWAIFRLCILPVFRARQNVPSQLSIPHPHFRTYRSRIFRLSAALLLCFLIFHVMYSYGYIHPEFDLGSPYHNLVSGFLYWSGIIALVYVAALIPFGFVLETVAWNSLSSLAKRHSLAETLCKPTVIRFLVWGTALLYAIVPISVLAGVVR